MESAAISNSLEEWAVREVFFWQHSYTGCFNNMLMDLFMKADGSNRMRLKIAYPELYNAWAFWYNSEDPIAYFEKHGLNVVDLRGGKYALDD